MHPFIFLVIVTSLVLAYIVMINRLDHRAETILFTDEGTIEFPEDTESALTFGAVTPPPSSSQSQNITQHTMALTDNAYLRFNSTNNGSIRVLRPLYADDGLELCGDLEIKGGGTIDGRIVSADGTTLDSLESIVDTNVLHLNGTETVTGEKTFNGMVHFLTPSGDSNPATKLYVDGMVQGFDHSKKTAVRVKTTVALPAHTSALGVLTATSNVALGAVNGVTLLVNERILVTEDGASNGIYVVSTVGSGSEPWELTRAEDALTISSGLSVFVLEGTVGSDTLWAVSTDATIVMETTSILFVQISTIGSIVIVDVGGATSMFRDKIGNTVNLRTLAGESGGPLSAVVAGGGDLVELRLDESKLVDTLTLISNNATAIGTNATNIATWADAPSLRGTVMSTTTSTVFGPLTSQPASITVNSPVGAVYRVRFSCSHFGVNDAGRFVFRFAGVNDAVLKTVETSAITRSFYMEMDRTTQFINEVFEVYYRVYSGGGADFKVTAFTLSATRIG